MESHRALRTMHWLISGADRDIESRRPGQGYVDVDIYELYGACVLATAAPQAPQTPQNRASESLPTGRANRGRDHAADIHPLYRCGRGTLQSTF